MKYAKLKNSKITNIDEFEVPITGTTFYQFLMLFIESLCEDKYQLKADEVVSFKMRIHAFFKAQFDTSQQLPVDPKSLEELTNPIKLMIVEYIQKQLEYDHFLTSYPNQ